MTEPASVTCRIDTADRMVHLGRGLGRALRAGDLVVLTGDLGAGKTTLARGIGQGLGVTEPVTSPTFVIARHHANASGPDLLHVDAYRLGSVREVEDLDLEADTEDCVTVVEWGEGLVEDLSPSRLTVRILRSSREDDEARTVHLEATGDRWGDALAEIGREYAS